MRPLPLIRAALIVLALFALAHLLGLRDATSFLSGTTAGGDFSWETSVVLGSIYLILYFAAVLGAPILLIASALVATARFALKPRRPL